VDKRIAIVNVTRMEGLAQGLEQAGIQLRGLFPLQPDTFSPKGMDPRDLLFLDGFRARFSDLQDFLGGTMFKTIAWMDEDEVPGREMTTRERLVLMEKRGLIDCEQWKDIREVRNNFTHEYPEEDSAKAINLNAAWQYVPVLLSVVQAMKDYARRQYGIGA